MFTGIIQSVGEIQSIQDLGGDRRVAILPGTLKFADVGLGDSIAVSGICLTVVEKTADSFQADVSHETLSLTTAGDWSAGSSVNLEKSLTLATPLGGHLVSGHVDGVAVVQSRHDDARSTRLVISLPPNLARYVARKGSIAVDGVSLTVNDVSADSFSVNIVPHTLQQTTMCSYDTGARVNLEIDTVARYLERLSMEATN